MEPETRQQYLQALPAVDEILRDPRMQSHLTIFSRALIVDAVRKILQEKRQAILQGKDGDAAPGNVRNELLAAVEKELARVIRPSLKPVINATGVVLHTNLGRAPLSPEALANIVAVARGYSNLEFDLAAGERGSRYEHVEEILCRITGAEAALVVNNNAGAVLITLNSLAEGKEVIVSRGQLVEIGGSFRIPDVMRKSGARLVEVGTTNRTHLSDYEKAIGPETALLLRVHTSNFRILGFTAEVPLAELVALGAKRGLPVMEDLGSGSFIDLGEYGLEREPTVQDAVGAGVDVVTFSGDKLLGGPQAGILLGKKNILNLLKKNPLNRALRIDKLTLAGLESTLHLYLNKNRAVEALPVLQMLICPAGQLKRRARRLQRKLEGELSSACTVTIKEEISQVGGGALPLQDLATWVIALRPRKTSAAGLDQRLRKNDPPIIARVKEEEVLLDLRTLPPREERILLQGIRQALDINHEGQR
ncbi:MAG: L-seryl-tRNA(Sec) selenium transferase [Deltaproteobacteria bacterium]|nr:L-seryl-tRNA(Sec) selenium transferase [Deltaproteobacteria bacterium]